MILFEWSDGEDAAYRVAVAASDCSVSIRRPADGEEWEEVDDLDSKETIVELGIDYMKESAGAIFASELDQFGAYLREVAKAISSYRRDLIEGGLHVREVVTLASEVQEYLLARWERDQDPDAF